MKKSQLAWLLSGLVLLSLALAGCSSGLAEKVWLEPPGWSRGVTIGSTSSGDATPLTLDAAGNLWSLLIHGQGAPELVSANAADGTTEHITLEELRGESISSARLAWSQEGIVVGWLASDQLWTATVDEQGRVTSPPARVESPIPVKSFDVLARASGEVQLWFAGDEDQTGLYRLSLASDAAPELIAEAGSNPHAVLGTDDRLHLVWIEPPSGQGEAPIHYRSEGMEQAVQLASPSLRPSDVFQGPLLAVEGDTGYLFYVTSIRTGLRAGEVDPMLITFPLVDPAAAGRPIRLTAPAGYELSYDQTPAQGLRVGPRAAATLAGGTTQLTQLALPQIAGPEAALAFRIRADFLMNQNQGQIGLMTFDRGAPNGYQLLSFTTGNSQHPSIQLDSEGHAYLSWKETSDEQELTLYLASTKPGWVANYASITADDMQRMLLQSLFGMASGVILLPMVLLWLIAPFLIVLLASFVRKAEDDWRHPAVWLPLFLAVVAYWFVKRALLPAIFEYVPFSAWVPIIPLWLGSILRVGLPITGTLLGVWLAYRLTFGQERNSPTFFILIFGAVDGIVTMLIYGGLLLGF